MENYDRKKYKAIKRTYENFHYLLIVARIIFLMVMLYLIVVSTLYAFNNKLNPTFVEISKNVISIAMPIIIIFWIAMKVVCVIYVKKLRVIKKELDIIDEI